MIISITSSDDIGLEDVEVASEIIAKEAHPDATIIWGVSFDDMLDDEMVVTVVATASVKMGAGGYRGGAICKTGSGKIPI